LPKSWRKDCDMDPIILMVKRPEDFMKFVREGGFQVFIDRDEGAPDRELAFVLADAPYPLVYGCEYPVGGWKDDNEFTAIEASVR
jgi:hypothetical protein